ncbi:surface lipoprotein assembly modifier [Novosphingobium sp. 1949]|uniref:Surface lipoprotein assembly modifier n=1 Tax=Novosphingobium organovorum TaxID=2930092 RepID=A0ABT0BE62_9SPHN|nr:porin family protein [Novosphingobium organovorum]MCJ2183138.1 surface lipoprotein assembly modifier [Novosphingobium organovorum]
MRARAAFASALALLLPAFAAHAADEVPGTLSASPAAPPATVTLTPGQLFAAADKARDSGDYGDAQTAYRALMANKDRQVADEARFRLALMLHEHLSRTREAAVLLREILDHTPDATPARVELARMQAAMGHVRSAERELRAARAAGLPPAVERVVDFYAGALNAQRPYGVSFDLALAPDNNINRATRSDTLGTIIGDFNLSKDAQAQSGLGLSSRGQVWGRLPIAPHLTLRAELNASGSFYRQDAFNDYALGANLGPRWQSGRDILAFSGTYLARWYGGQPYLDAWGGQASLRHPAGRRTQMSLEASAQVRNDHFSDARDGTLTSVELGLDRAFSARTGASVRVNGARQGARDPAYATKSLGTALYLYREMGGMTLVGSASYSHLEADERIFLYPRKRIDNRLALGLTDTLRALKVGSFAPVIGVTYERTWSTLELYDYSRISARFGITAAF